MISVQPANVDEVQKIKQVLSDTWIDTYSSFLPVEVIHKITSLWHSPEGLAAEIEDERVCFRVAKDDHGAILGLVTAGRPSDEVVYIGRLYVLPGHQRKGIGAKLLDACVTYFSGFQTLRLEVEAQNEKGMAFYRKQGFTETSRKEDEIEGISLVVVEMEKKIEKCS
ncbi:MAG: GNAT family N-acetyltransferase [Caldilineaceae bacterium]|nr:GNAT family N-acetyltransferase [Caldilineaceae bacterium]MDE0460843.1 GNAT family N-acetyltransferase [Caldilineaceae bacterium]